METNVNQKIYRSMLASMFSVSLATLSLCSLANQCSAQSVKKITSDPYYSALRQSAAPSSSLPPSLSSQSIYQPSWEPPKTDTKTTPARQAKIDQGKNAAEVWSSVARKTTKPVTRIDFSRLDINPPKKANVALPPANPQPLKPVAVAKAATKFKSQALTPIKAAKDINIAGSTGPITGSNAVKALTKGKPRSIIRQADKGVFAAAYAKAAATPAANLTPPLKAKPLTPQRSSSDFNMPRIGSKLPSALSKSSKSSQVTTASATTQDNVNGLIGKASKIASQADKGSFVQQAAYQPQVGKNLKKVGTKIKTLAGTDRNAPPPVGSGSGTRVADASNDFYQPGTTYTPQGEVYSPQGAVSSQPGAVSSQTTPIAGVHQGQTYQGESFENSRVLALVGGHPVFVGDMMFEVNQILEKFMKGAPQKAKDAQKGKLTERLLPKYIDQKLLYVSTLDQLPEEADIEDVLKQAEKTFNEKALPELMEKSGVDSASKFDAILRSQGSSVRQMRRAWAKDQISKFFLNQSVQFNRKVTHLEMLDEYRSNYDKYAIKGKVRWEQIEVQPSKAGGRFAAKDKTEDIYNRIVHGGNFEAIAKKESHGFRAFKGGQYDWTTKGSLVNKEIDKSIFSLPQGKLSGVIETKSGFHIIRVIERVEDHHTPFTEAQSEIKKQLLDDRRDAAFKTHIDGLKDKIHVEYVNE